MHEPSEFLALYEESYRRVDALIRPRWLAYDSGPNLSEAQLTDLLQRIVLHWFHLKHVNGQRVGVHARHVRDDRTNRIVQDVVKLCVPRFAHGHDELCAALLEISVDDYRTWTVGNDLFENR
ncbi:MAG TPA: hypothetical protein DGG94_02370 [Micromonosporaceae bacterium]|nr:hypothetical protein [Micromonosporaceae bacterium]HCU48665.1 hypothetical protein [Micromonosporaceae bacterium]